MERLWYMVSAMADKGMAGDGGSPRARHFVIYHDTRNIYFVRLGLGVFWECASNIGHAHVFTTRAQAAKVLTANGKQHYGWRVIPL